LRFSQKQDRSVPIFFQKFKRKHLFITTWIESNALGL